MADHTERRISLASRIRRAKLNLVLALLLLTVAAAILSLRYDISKEFHISPLAVIFAAGAVAIQGAALLMLLYLRGEVRIPVLDALTPFVKLERSPWDEQREHDVRELRTKLSDLQAQILSNDSAAHPGPLNTDKLIKQFRENVTSELAAEFEARVEKKFNELQPAANLRNCFRNASIRLINEISSLTSRGNLNLIIGIITTGIAVSLLVYMVLQKEGPFNTWQDLLTHYIPRVCTVIFIETFSFFFLRLYRSTLMDVKFFQNELTTLDIKYAALICAQSSDDLETRKNIATALVNADRNIAASERKGSETKTNDISEMADLLEKVTKFATSAAKKGADKGKD